MAHTFTKSLLEVTVIVLVLAELERDVVTSAPLANGCVKRAYLLLCGFRKATEIVGHGTPQCQKAVR